MVQGRDGGGFGESITLDDDIAEFAPELFESGVERRGADDEAPEFPAEAAMHAAILPPFAIPLAAARGIGGFGNGVHDVVAQELEHLWHAYQDGDAPAVDEMRDIARTICREEENLPGDDGGDESGHGLAEHVAQREEIEEANGREGPHVFAVFRDAFIDGL